MPREEEEDKGRVIYSARQVESMASGVQTLAKYFAGLKNGRALYEAATGKRETPTMQEAEDALAIVAGALGAPIKPTRYVTQEPATTTEQPNAAP